MTEWGREIEVNGVRPTWLKGRVLCDLKTYDWRCSDETVPGEIPAECWHWAHDGGQPNITHIRLPADHFAYKALDAGFEPWGGGDAAPEDYESDRTRGSEVLYRNGEQHSCGGSWRWSHYNHELDIIGYRKKKVADPIDWSKPLVADDGAALTVLSDDGDTLLLCRSKFVGTAYKRQAAFRRTRDNRHVGGPCGSTVIVSNGPESEPETVTLKLECDAGNTVILQKMTEVDAEGLWPYAPTRSTFVSQLRSLGLIREETVVERFTRETGVTVTEENRAAVEAALGWVH